LEFLTRSSTLSSPFYKTRPIGLPAHLPSVQMMAVDILPASIPLDASNHFSDVLLPYVKTLIREYRGEQPEDNEHMRALDRATIAKGGELTVRHRWLAEPVQAWRESADLQPETFSRSRLETPLGSGFSGTSAFNTLPKKKVLMLGSGMVAAPAVDEICKRSEVELLVGPYESPILGYVWY
jgi:alpha-aminoadipic semialdehyde synthase